MKIYLTGLPGSGKTTLGKQLAKALLLKFIDLDEEIEKAEGSSIPEIFSSKGEDYFRKIEQEQLLKTKELDGALISTGGGAPCFFDNAAFINDNGTSIFLDVSPKEIARRVSQGPNNRPLLDGVNSLEKEVSDKRANRLPFYSKANHIITGDNIQLKDLMELEF